MKQSLESLCTKIGLQDKEAVVFTQIALHGSMTVAQVTDVTSFNRATMYHILSILTGKRLLIKERVNGIYWYSLCDKELLDAFINKKVAELEGSKDVIFNILDRLPKRKADQRETGVEVFFGEDGVKSAFEYAFQAKKKVWDVIAPKSNFLSHTDELFVERYIEKRKKMVTRTLWELDTSNKKAPLHILKERNARYLSNEYRDKFTSLIILFDNSALLVASHKEQTATLIKSESIVSTLRVLFDGAWNSAEKIV